MLKIPKTQREAEVRDRPGERHLHAPVRGFFRLFGLYGTGFAPAKKNPVVSHKRSGMMIERKGSICLRGFNVSRPAFSAVSSPSRSAS